MQEKDICRIKCYDTNIDDLNRQIDDCVNAINEKCKQLETLEWNPKNEFEHKLKELKRKGCISTNDYILFPSTIVETYNKMQEIAGWIEKKFSAQPNGYVPKADFLNNYDAWILNHFKVPGAKDSLTSWVNEFSDDEESIIEYRQKGTRYYGSTYNTSNYKRPRIVFLRTLNSLGETGYLFKGIYEPQKDLGKAEKEQQITFSRIKTMYFW